MAIPASLCLLSLLQHKGDIVSHADLLNFAWKSRGMLVSPNTLYQNMSILRKALISLGVSDEIIKTVPKRGFVVPSGFPVEFTYESDVASLIESAKPTESTDLKNDADQNIQDEKSISHLRFVALATGCILAFCIAFFITNFLGEDTIPPYKPAVYSKIENFGDCQVFRNASFRSDAFFTQFLAEKKFVCGKGKWWYLTVYPPSPQISLLRCSHAINDKRKEKISLCTSDYYVETEQ